MKRGIPVLLFLLVLAAFAVLYFTGNLPWQEKPEDAALEGPCAYTWASQPLPELSQTLQQRLEQQEILATEVRAAAYGENCVLADGTVAHFLTRQTDLYFQVPVTEIEDRQTQGEIAAQIIQFVDDIPAGTLVGPQEGYIQINYTTSTGQMQSLWFSISEGRTAIESGLQGAELFAELAGG
jgi:hypothetical protein